MDIAATRYGNVVSVESPHQGFGSARLTGAVGGFIALGLLLRLVRYAVNYPIWHDEAFVAVNFLDRGYLDLLRPLDYAQVCPLLFLWAELTAVKLGGYSEWSLRFFPTLCALASVGLFWDVSRRINRGSAHLLAVAIFAISFTPIRHGAEVKPYASDLLAALVLLRFALGWLEKPASSFWLWASAAAAPIVLGVSYPAVFVASGLCLALAPRALFRSNRVVRTAFLVCCASVLLSFVALFAAFTSAQSAELTSRYRWGYWLDSFPPTRQPWRVPWWFLRTHVGMLMAYPIGGDAGASAGTFACVVAGAAALWKRGRREMVGVLCAPFGMGLLAACLGRYPYGGEARFMQYVAPATCLLMGIGLAAVVDRRSVLNFRFNRRKIVVAALAVLGVAQLMMDFVKPYRDREDVLSRRFAQWFWNEQARDAELICARTDLGLRLDGDPLHWQRGTSSIYQCYQALYSPRRRRRETPDLGRISIDHPLKIVFFDRLPVDNPYFSDWLHAVERKLDLRSRADYVVYPPRTAESWKRDGCVVLEFVPKRDPAAPDSPVFPDGLARRIDPFGGRF